MTGSHADGTDGEHGAATDTVDPEHGGDGGDEHDDADDAGCEELGCVAALTELLEDCWGVVQHSVDTCHESAMSSRAYFKPGEPTSPLLEEHGHTSNHTPFDQAPRLKQRSNRHKLQLKDVPSGRLTKMRELLRHRTLFEQRLRLNLQEFKLDELMIFREAAKTGKVAACFALAVVVDEPTGGEGHEGHTAEENETGGDLEADGDEPCGVGLLATLCAADVVGSAENGQKCSR